MPSDPIQKGVVESVTVKTTLIFPRLHDLPPAEPLLCSQLPVIDPLPAQFGDLTPPLLVFLVAGDYDA